MKDGWQDENADLTPVLPKKIVFCHFSEELNKDDW